MNKKIIAIIIIVLLAIIGSFTYAQFNQSHQVSTNGKLNTKVDFQSTFSAGDNDTDGTVFILKDMEGNGIANKNVSITYKIDGKDETFYATTDDDGKVDYVLVDMDKGNVDVVVKFDGDDKYNPSSETQPHISFGD